MAFTLSTIYKAQDKFSGPLRAMEKANARFAASQSKALGALKNSFVDVRNRLIGLAGNISTAALMMSGFNAVKDFDESLASLRAITGLTGKAFIPFKQEIMAVGDATKMAYPDVAKAFELIGSAKPELLDNAKAMGQMTKAAILLSKASGMDLTMSAASLTKAMNQFGVGADQAAKFVDILSTSEQKGTATTQQIVDALINGGSTAKTLGLSFDETNAVIQAYAKAGVLGSEAGTQMAAVLGKLATVTKKEFNPTQVGATKAIDNLAKANLKYTDILALVGPEKAKFLATLLTQNPVLQKLSGNLYDVGNAQKQANERSQSFTVAIEQLTAKFKNLFISANESTGMLGKFGGVVVWVTDNLGAILTVIGVSIAAYASYYAIMTTIRLATIAYNIALGIYYATQASVPIALGASAIAMNAYAIATNIAQAATWLFSAALWSTGIPEIILGIVALGVGIYMLIKYWKEITNWVTTSTSGWAIYIRVCMLPMILLFKYLRWAISSLIDVYVTLYKWFTNTAVFQALIVVAQAIGTAFQALGDIFSGVIGKIKEVWKWIKMILGPVLAPFLKILGITDTFAKQELTNTDNADAKPVNTIAASNDAQTSRYEEINKNQLSIMLQNRSDKQVNVTKNTGMIPLSYQTF
jgi:TP901 family phage tail tape measure protein